MSSDVSVEIIGYISSCFTEKFGTPRQPGLVPLAEARLKMIEPFNRSEMFRGLGSFTHLWVQFLFHQAVADGWKTTVRPPRLGGSERKGIWATRSPHRPNFIGLSAVALKGVECNDGVELILGGVDFLDQTPVIDIKPYLPSSDCLTQAAEGWAETDFARLEVTLSKEADAFCKGYEQSNGMDLAALIVQVLSTDVRPPSQRGRKEQYGTRLFDVNIRWQVDGRRCFVVSCELTG
ncbi:MAG: tRNA (N6-threonylcarbamoyladenosine(37)-N6)-methyltransferase TrmO [Desulfofustis sp.]